MADLAIRKACEGLRIGRVLVGGEDHRGAWRNDPPDELGDGLPRRLGVRPPVGGLERGALAPLARPQGAAAAKLGVVEAVDVVRGPDQEVQVEGPVLAVLEGPQAVEHQRLGRCALRPERLEQQQAVASQALALALHAAVGEAELAGDLAQGRAADEAMEEGAEPVRVLEPVGGGEGL